MSFSRKSLFFICFAGFACISLSKPFIDIVIDEPPEDITISMPELPEYSSKDESCPGRGYNGPVIMESAPLARGLRIMEPPLAAAPRSLSEDSIMAKSLEDFVRAKRHAGHSTTNSPVTVTTTPKPVPSDDIKELLGSDDEDESSRKTNTTEVLGQLNLAREVDLCFLVDVTGSMSPYIAGVRDSINDIVDDLLNSTVTENFVEDLRISFVGYRDFGDGEDQFTMFPFTNNVTEFRDFVADTPASGGANVPEDVFGGLDKALNLQWGEPSRTRLIFHIADAPGHGCELHLLASDDFPGGDPKERTAEGLFGKLKEMKIQYFFGNITADTDVMISKFSEALGAEVKTFDIGVSGSSSGGFGYGAYEAGGLRGAPAAASIYESVKSAVEDSVGKRVEASK